MLLTCHNSPTWCLHISTVHYHYGSWYNDGVCAYPGSTGADSKVTKIFKRSGVGKVELDSASAGDVVSIAGAPSAGIADTIGDVELAAPLSPGPIEPPTLRYSILVAAHLSGLPLPQLLPVCSCTCRSRWSINT